MKGSRRLRRRKCRCCRQWFMPQAHNAYHQRYCGQDACRRASRWASYRKFIRKHPDEYKGNAPVLRVRAWRSEHPGYWRRPRIRTEFRVHQRDYAGTSIKTRIVAEHWEGDTLQNIYVAQLDQRSSVMRRLVTALQNLSKVLPRWKVQRRASQRTPGTAGRGAARKWRGP